MCVCLFCYEWPSFVGPYTSKPWLCNLNIAFTMFYCLIIGGNVGYMLKRQGSDVGVDRQSIGRGAMGNTIYSYKTGIKQGGRKHG